jgi:predicted TIM-barrel fold metal-dependent hydrolase
MPRSAVRGQSQKAKKDGIYRASLRGDSTYLRTQAEAVALELLKGDLRVEPGKRMLVENCHQVIRHWRAVANRLANTGQHGLADEARQFVNAMRPPMTDREVMVNELRRRVREPRVRDRQLNR